MMILLKVLTSLTIGKQIWDNPMKFQLILTEIAKS
jgi:hypothetical protein